MTTQNIAIETFRRLHESGCFVLPNPWDLGSALYLEHLGFKALATTSAGFAFSKGLPDGTVSVSRDMAFEHFREISEATSLPVNADFHLRTGSPAAGTGKDGEDMGAYPFGGSQPGLFVRGDANDDGGVDISDPLQILFYVSGQTAAPSCLDALDADDSGGVGFNDALRLLNFLFLTGPSPAAPFPNAGIDATTGDPYTCP